ncbi:unnamed protein product, partial [Arabidopsis halleri]
MSNANEGSSSSRRRKNVSYLYYITNIFNKIFLYP